jgi:hypothetical protein
MKRVIFFIALFIWLVCGVAGAWMLDELSARHWDAIARGPITLAKAFNERPVTYPGP